MAVLAGARNGVMGLYVSQAGADVFAANEFDLLFSSNFARLKLIGVGSFQFSNFSDPRQADGAAQQVTNVPWPDGKTYNSHLPFVAAIGMSFDYTLHIQTGEGANASIDQCSNLNGIWITSTAIVCPDYLFTQGVHMPGSTGANFFPGSPWYQLSFEVRPFPSFCQFATSTLSGCNVKYLMYDPLPSASS